MTVAGVYHIKGGVGKTTTAVNLAYLAAENGRRTLLWDLDSQAASTFYFRTEAKPAGKFERVVEGSETLAQWVEPTEYAGLYLIPAHWRYGRLEAWFGREKPRKRVLGRMLESVKDDFDLILLDCPPSLGLLAENVFRCADVILVPNIPTTLSLRAYVHILTYLREQEEPLEKVIPFFSMADRRKKMHMDNVRFYTERIPRMCRTVIPYLSEIERMGWFRRPIPEELPESVSAQAYRELWKELEPVLFGTNKKNTKGDPE